MTLPTHLARQLTEEHIEFVRRTGLKAEILEPGFVRLRMPLQGNQNHIGSMYAGALFTLAELPGGALFLTSFDTQRFYPVVKNLDLRFVKPATSDVFVEAHLSAEQIEQLQQQANQYGKAEFVLNLKLTNSEADLVTESCAHYQLRTR